MKILKRMYQKNVSIDKYYYTAIELYNVLKANSISEILFGYTPFRLSNDNSNYEELDQFYTLFKEYDDISIFTSFITDIKVVDRDGFYTTAAITKSGNAIYIKL